MLGRVRCSPSVIEYPILLVEQDFGRAMRDVSCECRVSLCTQHPILPLLLALLLLSLGCLVFTFSSAPRRCCRCVSFGRPWWTTMDVRRRRWTSGSRSGTPTRSGARDPARQECRRTSCSKSNLSPYPKPDPSAEAALVMLRGG